MKYFVPIFALLLVITMVPANAGWLFEYNINYTGGDVGFVSSSPGVGHSRGGDVIGEDSFFFNNTGRPTVAAGAYQGLIYNNCTGASDVPIFTNPVWTNPSAPSDTIAVTWNWGVAADVGNNQLFVSNQDSEYSVLVFDLTGAPTQYRNELGFWGQNTYYPSQISLDATGDIFLANYGMSWIPDASPAVGNICWYPAVANDADWATGGANPHNPALGGIYSAIQGATQAYGAGLLSYDGATWICEGVDVSADGSILVYTSRGGATQGVHVALGSPAAGYTLAASNEATLLPWFTSVTGDTAISNVRGCALAPDEQHIFFVIDDTVPNDLIGVWNWVTGAFADPIFLTPADPSVHQRPADREQSSLPYDVDVYADDVGSPFALNVMVSGYYNWLESAKFTGNLTTDVRDWSLY